MSFVFLVFVIYFDYLKYNYSMTSENVLFGNNTNCENVTSFSIDRKVNI